MCKDVQRAETDLDRHREDLERFLGPEYRSTERYTRMVEQVVKGRTAANVVLDLKGL